MNAPMEPVITESAALPALTVLLERLCRVTDSAELDFMAVNDTHLLAPYRQASLWTLRRGTIALSGVATIERNAPYVQWLDKVCAQLPLDRHRGVIASDLAPDLSEQWSEWLGPYGLWVPLTVPLNAPGVSAGGILLSREEPWQESEALLVSAWMGAWAVARHAVDPLVRRLSSRVKTGKAGFGLAVLAVVVAALFIPVPISVLAPGELVPVEPMPVRAPLDGVVREFYVRPNQVVKAGDPLFSFDVMQIASRLEVATQALTTAQVELRQLSQQALADPRARAQLAGARGNVAEKRAEADYLQGQRGRARVLAAESGIALFDDPHEWIGRPVATGERILRIASDSSKEIEAWVAVGDAIALPADSPAKLYLSSSPLDPVGGRVRYVSHEAVKRPDGNHAYRVRATLDAQTDYRIGLRGTVRLSGERVALGYWMFRRPIAAIREFFGV